MHPDAARRGRVLATLVAAGAHTYLATLGAIHMLNYTVDTTFEVLALAASSEAWTWIHGACAVLLVGAVAYGPEKHLHARWRQLRWRCFFPVGSIACSVSFAMLTTWAFFSMVWGLTTVRPVSLAGPGLAFVVAFGEQLLANAWMRGTHCKGR